MIRDRKSVILRSFVVGISNAHSFKNHIAQRRFLKFRSPSVQMEHLLHQHIIIRTRLLYKIIYTRLTLLNLEINNLVSKL